MAMLSDMGINVIEDEDVDEPAAAEESDDEDGESEGGELAPSAGTAVATAKKKEPTDRTDDPVRMYLREMGSVELLSREGEIAIAKRIEAGRETMISGPLRKPADLPGADHLARRTQRRHDAAARHHRSRSHLCRSGRQELLRSSSAPEKIEADRKAAEEKAKARRQAPSAGCLR